MTDFYDASGAPASHSFGYSSQMRAEFSAIGTAFDKLPALSGNAAKILRVNAAGTAVEVVDVSTLLTGYLTTASAATTYLGITANAVSATQLATARAINGVNFDGTAPITINAVDSTARVAKAGDTMSGALTANYAMAASPTALAGVGVHDTGTSTNRLSLQVNSTGAYIVAGGSSANPDIVFTNNDGSAEGMRLTATGNLTVVGSITSTGGSLVGNASTATKLATPRAINGVNFDGSAPITISAVAAAGSLTGSTLAAGVTASSLTSLGTLGSLSVSGTASAGAFSGPLTGNVTGNVSGSSGSVAGSGSVACATVTASGLIKGNGGGAGLGAITVSASAPSGGSDGDIWLQI